VSIVANHFSLQLHWNLTRSTQSEDIAIIISSLCFFKIIPRPTKNIFGVRANKQPIEASLALRIQRIQVTLGIPSNAVAQPCIYLKFLRAAVIWKLPGIIYHLYLPHWGGGNFQFKESDAHLEVVMVMKIRDLYRNKICQRNVCTSVIADCGWRGNRKEKKKREKEKGES
jgi:hypothetical protein